MRAELNQHAVALSRPPPPEDVPLLTVLAGLTAFVEGEEAAAQRLKERLASIDAALTDLSLAAATAAEAAATLKTVKVQLSTATAKRDETERWIAAAKELANRAQALRTAKVKQVFIEELNSVWHELFIRLASEEAVVRGLRVAPVHRGAMEAVL